MYHLTARGPSLAQPVSRLARRVTAASVSLGDNAVMTKLPAGARRLARRSIGIGRAQPISATALHELASRDDVVVIGVGMLGPGAIDPRLPGEQRTASLSSLPSVVADLARDRVIVLHCG